MRSFKMVKGLVLCAVGVFLAGSPASIGNLICGVIVFIIGAAEMVSADTDASNKL